MPVESLLFLSFALLFLAAEKEKSLEVLSLSDITPGLFPLRDHSVSAVCFLSDQTGYDARKWISGSQRIKALKAATLSSWAYPGFIHESYRIYLDSAVS